MIFHRANSRRKQSSIMKMYKAMEIKETLICHNGYKKGSWSLCMTFLFHKNRTFSLAQDLLHISLCSKHFLKSCSRRTEMLAKQTVKS